MRQIAVYWCDASQTTRKYPVRQGVTPVQEFTTPTGRVFTLVLVSHVPESYDAATLATIDRTPYVCTRCDRPDCTCDWYEETEAERAVRMRGLNAVTRRVMAWTRSEAA